MGAPCLRGAGAPSGDHAGVGAHRGVAWTSTPGYVLQAKVAGLTVGSMLIPTEVKGLWRGLAVGTGLDLVDRGGLLGHM